MKTDKQEKELHEVLDSIEMTSDSSLPTYEIADKVIALENKHSYIGQVTEFMETFKQTSNHISKDTMKLRLDLILEELIELAEGCGKEIASQFAVKLHDHAIVLHQRVEESKVPMYQDYVAIMDAHCDLQYVLSGSIVAFNQDKVFDECFEEVHRSNMSKACNSLQVAEQTKDTYASKGVECYIDVQDADKGVWFVRRTGDKKMLKSNEYSPANLNSILYPNQIENGI